MLSLQVLQGEYRLVNLVEDWEILEEYGKIGFYQLLDDGAGEKVEVRVLIGGCGFVKEFDDPKDEVLQKILDYCKRYMFVKINKNVHVSGFFK